MINTLAYYFEFPFVRYALIVGVLGNIMNLINLASYPQMVVKAAVIVLAVLLKSLSSKRHG